MNPIEQILKAMLEPHLACWQLQPEEQPATALLAEAQSNSVASHEPKIARNEGGGFYVTAPQTEAVGERDVSPKIARNEGGGFYVTAPQTEAAGERDVSSPASRPDVHCRDIPGDCGLARPAFREAGRRPGPSALCNRTPESVNTTNSTMIVPPHGVQDAAALIQHLPANDATRDLADLMPLLADIMELVGGGEELLLMHCGSTAGQAHTRLNEARPDEQCKREGERKRSLRAVNGDCSRRRRFRDAVRRAYYGRHRQMRFARRCLGRSA